MAECTGFLSGARTRPLLTAETAALIDVRDSSRLPLCRVRSCLNDVDDANALEQPVLEAVSATTADASGASALMAMSTVANADEGNSPGGGEVEAAPANPKVMLHLHSLRESLPSRP